jgi:hypothetical protein
VVVVPIDDGREGAEKADAVGEGKPVSHVHEHPRSDVVAREEEQKPREVVERGVGGQEQDQRRGRLHVAVQHAVPELEVGELESRGCS